MLHCKFWRRDILMRDDTGVIHSGIVTNPATHAVATPIYHTVAYEFDSARHGGDLFNLVVPGNISTRIMNPTNDVLADLEQAFAVA
jgi:O-acetylhomoserine (thiol)-lyase